MTEREERGDASWNVVALAGDYAGLVRTYLEDLGYRTRDTPGVQPVRSTREFETSADPRVVFRISGAIRDALSASGARVDPVDWSRYWVHAAGAHVVVIRAPWEAYERALALRGEARSPSLSFLGGSPSGADDLLELTWPLGRPGHEGKQASRDRAEAFLAQIQRDDEPVSARRADP